ncbi:AAA family ATPase [Microbacterium ulmi]|uniref:AAA family ATPase n=1 Tax=Microbacterium ulmi TaxID=179095 RepID=A0A7Y2LZN1_9MICO|nr:AAA family ATPase [Microbacterium ulmi]NII69890.1 hypothetical protein [Microbacterium ulmi]NNH03810.1 AAA family ATPase [Microbacterium ulmi]
MSEPETVTLADRGRWFAALSGPFDPVALLEALGDLSPAEAMDVTVDLSSVCDTSDPVGWLMRGTVRRDELDVLAESGRLATALEWRRAHERSAPTDDLLAALTGTAPFTEEGISAALQPPLDHEVLTRMSVALDRAGVHAPASASREAVRSAVARADAGARANAMLSRGFFGREDELSRAEAWLGRPRSRRPVTALFVNGLPGIGKSTFIDEVARRAAEQAPPWIIVRLDFDRGGLDIQDRVGLTMEITRQITRELGEDAAALRTARLLAAGAGPATNPSVKGGDARAHIPDELARVLGDSLASSGRRVLLILDTVEVLRGRGETHPLRLFETLDELCDRGLSPLAVIAAGRGEPFDIIPERTAERVELGGLDDDSADGLLGGFDIEPAVYPRIRGVSDGIPLVLRLGALAVRESGPDVLDGITGRRELASAYLYRFLLSRIDNDTLRSLAQPGLIVRRINADLIAEVLAPQVGMKGMPATDAVAAFAALTTQHWLVEPDAVPGWVRHRSDIRKTLLENIYDAGRPSETAHLNRAAARWFADRTEPFAPFEAAYHHLQAMRSGGQPPSLSREILYQFDDDTLAELPDVARDVVRIARGDRSSLFREQAPVAAIDHESAARELESILERADIREAEYVYQRSFGQSPPDPASAAADIARSFLWRAGRWAEALDGFDPRRYFSGRFRDSPPTTTLAQFEMWAESGFGELARAFIARPELAEMAIDLRRRGLTGTLGNGALGFALLAVDAPRERDSWSMSDPVDAAVSVWSATNAWESGAPSPMVLDALAMQAGRFSTQVSTGPASAQRQEPQPTPRLPDLSTPAGAARVLASATPYSSVIQARLGLTSDSAIRDHLARTDQALSAAGGLPPTGAGDWRLAAATSAEGSVENLAALGLLSEWMGAAAFALRAPDLRAIARSAERWRRTCAGDWAYPIVPGLPTWTRRPDASVADRIAQLGSREDCLAEVRIWSGAASDDEASEIVRKVRGRYPAADLKTRGEAPAEAAAALLDHDVAAAFVPAIAVLSAIEGKVRP